MTTHQLCDILNEFAPLSLQDSWDNSGLQIDNNNAEVTGVLVCFDITEKSLQEAIDKHCNVIVAHHPLLFHGLKQIGNDAYIERCVRMAIVHNIAIYCNHTPLDKVQDGISWKLGEKLGLQNLTYLQTDGIASYGTMGEFSTPLSEKDFINLLKSTFGLTYVRCSEPLNKAISKVALCGGSGAFLIDDALKAGADAFVCGDIKHHEFYKAEQKILLADIGHFESEIATKEIFFSILSKKIPTFVVHLSENDKSPIYCF
ncbi:MAG: Nif3-like dinuclear metal center hexameric protein [Paludibacteraceae bacterium]|nr:Nif3-like dinuclear metal center hexameric protein [Paludibacteraceae bacterium]